MEKYNSTSPSFPSAPSGAANASDADMTWQTTMADVANVVGMTLLIPLVKCSIDWGLDNDVWDFGSKAGKTFIMFFIILIMSFVSQFLALPTGYYARDADDFCAKYWSVTIVLNRLLNAFTLFCLLYRPIFILEDSFLKPELYWVIRILLIFVLTNEVIILKAFGFGQDFKESPIGCVITTEGVENSSLYASVGYTIGEFAKYAQAILYVLALIYPFLYLCIVYKVKLLAFYRHPIGQTKAHLTSCIKLCLLYTFSTFSLNTGLTLVSLMVNYKRLLLVRYLSSALNFAKFVQLVILLASHQTFVALMQAIQRYIIHDQGNDYP